MADVAVEAPVAAPVTLAGALLAVQGEVTELGLAADGTGQVGSSRDYKYLTLSRLMTAVRPLLTKNGLLWQTFPTTLDGKPALSYRVFHVASEQALEDMMLLMMDKQTSQAQGSALTYSKRQALLSVLGLTADKDDDGAAASQPARPAPADPEAPLPEESVNAMLEAITERGLSVVKVFERAGVKDGESVSVGDSRKVKALLDRHDAKGAGS